MELNYQQLFEKAFNKRKLLSIHFELTYNCNFACKFCYNPVYRKGQERIGEKKFTEPPLTLEEYKELFKKLRKGGVLFLTLSGGEPLVHPNFFEILKEAKNNHFCVRVFSNGFLIDKNNAKKLKENGAFCVEISIYGASRKTYKDATGVEEGFERAWNAIKHLKEEGVVVYLKCILSKFTENEMDKIQELADENNAILRWDHILSASEDGYDYPLKYTASPNNLERLFSEEKFKVGPSPFERGEDESMCTIGKMSLNIDPYGNINPCVEWKEAIGNVRRDDIFYLWENSKRLKEIMEVAKEVAQKVKNETSASDFCFNCIGRSRSVYGDPYKIEPCEIKVAELKKRFYSRKKDEEKP